MSWEQKPGFVFRKSRVQISARRLAILKNNNKKRCHLIFYCIFYRLNMFQALLSPSSGAHDYDVVYHIGHVVLGLLHVGG